MNASTRVLDRLGFERIGELNDAEEGSIWHWRLNRPSFQIGQTAASVVAGVTAEA